MKLNFIQQYRAKRTIIDVFETDIKINQETIYVIIAHDKNSMKENTRFGNAVQTKSIINTYHLEKKFRL